MTKLQRDVVVDTLKVLFATLLVTSLIFTLGAGVREGVRKGLPIQMAFRAMPYLTPEILRLTIPGSFLFAICTVFGRMSAAGEITVLKSLGINPWRIVAPVLATAYLLSIFTFWLYDVCAVWSRPGLYRLAVTSVHEMAYNALRKDGVFKVGDVTVTARSLRGEVLQEPLVEVDDANQPRATLLRAREAVLETIGDTGNLRIRSVDTCIELPENTTLDLPAEFSQDIDVGRSHERRTDASRAPAEIRMSRLARQVQLEQGRVSRLLAAAEVDAGSREELDRRRRRLYRLRAEGSRRLANGFAAFSFATIGIPVSIRRRSTDNMTVFFTCFAPITLIYYPLLTAGEEMARRGVMPVAAVWLAPLTLGLIGFFFIRQLLRY